MGVIQLAKESLSIRELEVLKLLARGRKIARSPRRSK